MMLKYHAGHYVNISIPTWYFISWLLIFSLYTANPLLTVLSISVLPLFVTLLWRKAEPPVLLYVVFFQWLQVTAKVFHADVLGISVVEMFGHDEIKQAILLSLISLFALALGMHITQGRLGKLPSRRVKDEVTHFSLNRLFTAYFSIATISFLFGKIIWEIPQLTQILVALMSLKWVFFFLLAYTVLYRREKYVYLLIVVMFEVISGLTGYFSDFKHVFFLLPLVFLTLEYKINKKNFVRIASVAIAVVVLSLIWTGVKSSYRVYLSEGSGQQLVSAPLDTRLDKLMELSMQINLRDIPLYLDMLAGRIAQVDYFAHTLARVPRALPYEKGELWGRAIKHVFMPRLLFPDKKEIASDSELTMKYTGISVAGAEQGVSIGIGYLAQSYIDFGPWGMHFPILIIGVIWGLMYNYFISRTKYKIIGYSVAVAVLTKAYLTETDQVKLLGGMFMSFIVMALLIKFIMPSIGGWLVKRRT